MRGWPGAVEEEVSKLVKPRPVGEATVVYWRLDSARRPPNVEVMAEVEAALGTVLGAETPAEVFKRLVSRQRAGAVVARGSWASTGRVQHRVHSVEVARARLGLQQRGEVQVPRAQAWRRDEEGWSSQRGEVSAAGRRCRWR